MRYLLKGAFEDRRAFIVFNSGSGGGGGGTTTNVDAAARAAAAAAQISADGAQTTADGAQTAAGAAQTAAAQAQAEVDALETVVAGLPADGSIDSSKVVDGSLTNADLASMGALTVKGNNAGTAGTPTDLTGAQVTALLEEANDAAKGLVSGEEHRRINETPIKVFDTMAQFLADTTVTYDGSGGIAASAGDFVRVREFGLEFPVLADGTAGFSRQNAAGVPVLFAEAKADIQEIYADSVSGSDDNHGRSPNAPLQTLAKAVVVATAQGDGCTIRLRTNSSWQEALDTGATDATFSPDAPGLEFVTVEAYGDLFNESPPEVLATRAIAETVQDSTDRGDGFANVYSFTATYPFGVNQKGLPPFVFKDKYTLHEVVQDVATVQATQQSQFNQYTDNGDGTVTVTTYFHTPDSSDPRPSIADYSVTERTWAVRVGNNSTVRNISAGCQGHDNGAINGGFNVLFENCFVWGNPYHNALAASGVMDGLVAWVPTANTVDGAGTPQGRIMLEFFTPSGGGHTGVFKNCITVSKKGEGGSGLGGHTSNPTADADRYDRVDVFDCTVINSSVNFQNVVDSYSRNVCVEDGRFRIVSGSASGDVQHVNPRVIMTGAVQDTALDGGALAQSGGSKTKITGPRMYFAAGYTGQAMNGYDLDVRNGSISYETDTDITAFRNTSGSFRNLTMREMTIENRGLGRIRLLHATDDVGGTTYDVQDNVYGGIKEWVINGTTYQDFEAYKAATNFDSQSLVSRPVADVDLQDAIPLDPSNAWDSTTTPGEHVYTGAGTANSDRIQFYNVTGAAEKLVFLFTVSGGTVDLVDAPTAVETNIGPGTYAKGVEFANNVSLRPNGGAVTISEVSIFALDGTNDPFPKDPENGNFRMVGDTGQTGAGVLNPGVEYLIAPTTRDQARDFAMMARKQTA